MAERMLNSRNLSAEEHKELDDWLNTKEISLNHRTRRDLSDVVNMALLFKNVDAKLVNMKNYTSHGNLALKLLNWETFNLKVLRKTGLILMRPALEQLASGDLNAIRSLLFHLMRIERDGIQLSSRRASPTKGQRQQSDNRDDAHEEARTRTLIPTEPPTPNQKQSQTQSPTQNETETNALLSHNLRVTYANYEELKRINEKKEQYIGSLSQKVQYLEKVILEKEKRINELVDHLSTLSVRIISMQTSLTDDALAQSQPQPQPE